MATRDIFTEKAFYNMGEYDTLKATDKKTGIRLSYNFNPHAGGYIAFEFPNKPDDGLLIQVDGDEVNRVATLICDGYEKS